MLRVKRGVDSLSDSLSDVQLSGCSYRATPPKRVRLEGHAPSPSGQEAHPTSPCGTAGAGATWTPPAAAAHAAAAQEDGGRRAAQSRAFPERSLDREGMDQLLDGVLGQVAAGGAAAGTPPHEAAAPGQGGKGGAQAEQRMYSTEEMREIVHRAVALREEALRLEYGVMLHEKLQDQFSSFTRFNADYISRQIKGNPFSYVS